LASSLVVPVSFAAKGEPPVKKPAMKIDASPVSEGKGTVLTSYADIVEPVQKRWCPSTRPRSSSSASRIHCSGSFSATPLLIRNETASRKASASGVISFRRRLCLTNNHVIEGADELKVSLTDDREFTAKVIGADPKTDVAVIKIDADKLPSLTLADSDKLRVGDVVFAVGNPLGVGQTVTMGIVSAKGRNQLGLLENVAGYESFIQTDAAINMGNSGGALVDAKGRLVGVNSAIISPSRGNIGIGFAIPINFAASVMNSLIETGTVTRGYLGVLHWRPVTTDVAEQLGLPKTARGVAITDITPDSPAEKGGLEPHRCHSRH